MGNKLLFVTCAKALERRLGDEHTFRVLDRVAELAAAGVVDIDEAQTPSDAASKVVKRLQSGGAVDGVVIVGGYDVVPSFRMDCLPASLRSTLTPYEIGSDADLFVVWSDEPYVDLDGDSWPDLPVSRVPDGGSGEFLTAALSPQVNPRRQSSYGIRNIARPFADFVYALLSQNGAMLQSHPTVYNGLPRPVVSAQRVYLMLHGAHADGTRFWGEPSVPEAMNISNLGGEYADTVFAGCCWGALVAENAAARQPRNYPVTARAAKQSLAMSFLERGARAFVGCTGTHYSPTAPPYKYFGGPLHEAFWKEHMSGEAPARALHKAKQIYRAGMPHGLSGVGTAIEYKLVRQYTCLGLGW